MKRVLLIIALFFGSSSWADVNNTWTADGSVETRVNETALLILNGTWGGGTVTVYVKAKDDSVCGGSGWCTTGQTYTADDADVINLGDVSGIVRITLAGATSPTLYYEIRN